MAQSMIEQCAAAAEAAGFRIWGADFLCRALAIIYCYGGGPGGEHFRTPLGHTVAMKAGELLDESIRKRNFEVVKKFRGYVHELQQNNASWLEMTLDRLNIPASEIKFSECVQQKSAKGT